MTCDCHVCTPAWLEKFFKDLAEGRVIHIGNTPDGRPIYRQN